MDHAIGRIHGDDRALQHIALLVARRDVEQGIPAADVGPAEVAGDHRGAVGLFHYRVIDGFLWRAGEGFFFQPQKAEIGRGIGDGGLNGLRHFRLHAPDLAQEHVGAEQEVAGIP